MLRSSYAFRNFIKARIAQFYAAGLYATLHPYSTIQKLAHESTVAFILEKCPEATPCRTPNVLMDLALDSITLDGGFVECGVFKGASINYLARKFPHKTIHGFDSFDGLQEAWLHNAKSTFTLGGQLPKVAKNVLLHKGYFEDTLPKWASINSGPIAFLHIDCDLYSSTLTVFETLGDFIQAGTIIVFDDYFNFQAWEKDGHLVFSEFVKDNSVEFESIGYAYKEYAVRITAIRGLS